MARNFNGGTDRIHWYDNADTQSYNLGCVAFWMKSTSATSQMGVCSNWSSSARNGWGMVMNSTTANKLSFIGYTGAAQRVNIESTSSVNTGSWVHVAANYDRDSGQANELFINGASEVSANSSGSWTTIVAYFFTAGDMFDGFFASYIGDLAEVAHWRGAKLDTDSIAALARGVAPIHIRPTYLDLYAPMIDNAVNFINPSHSAPAGTYLVTGTTVSDHPRRIG